jgi:hypothetical protein
VIAVGDITVFENTWKRGANRRPHSLAARPATWAVLLTASAGLVLLGAGTHGDVSQDSISSKPISRAEVTGITLPEPVVAQRVEPVSHQLRRPVRAIDRDARQHDLRQLVSNALETFDYAARAQDRLKGLLLMALSEGRTDQQIDDLLNKALSQGDFVAPALLVTPQYRFDTRKLLDAVLAQAAI